MEGLEYGQGYGRDRERCGRELGRKGNGGREGDVVGDRRMEGIGTTRDVEEIRPVGDENGIGKETGKWEKDEERGKVGQNERQELSGARMWRVSGPTKRKTATTSSSFSSSSSSTSSCTFTSSSSFSSCLSWKVLIGDLKGRCSRHFYKSVLKCRCGCIFFPSLFMGHFSFTKISGTQNTVHSGGPSQQHYLLLHNFAFFPNINFVISHIFHFLRGALLSPSKICVGDKSE